MKSKPNAEVKEINRTQIDKNNNSILSESEIDIEKNKINKKNEKNYDTHEKKDEREKERGKEKEIEKDKNEEGADDVWNLEGPEFDPMAVLGLTLKIQKVNNLNNLYK